MATEEKPSIEQLFLEKSLTWNETNEEIAKTEAYQGVYTVEDDGQPEPVETADDVLNALLGVMG